MAREGWRVGREEDAEDCVWFAGALITLIQQDLQSVRGPSNDTFPETSGKDTSSLIWRSCEP